MTHPLSYPSATELWHWQDLRLFTLGPLHIGTGDTLGPMDYVVDGTTFYKLEQAELFRLVREFTDGPRILGDWATEQSKAMQDLRDNRDQSQLNSKINPLEFFRQQGKQDVLLNYLRQRGGQPLRLDDDNRHRRDQRLGDVRECIRTGRPPNPYLPGSTVKGALRTALLYDFLQRHGQDIGVERIVKDQLANRRTHRRGLYFASPLEAAVFYCQQEERGRKRDQEAQMDLLKYLAVPDVYDTTPDSLTAGVAKINIYLVEQERHGREKTGRLLASRQPQASYAEIVPGGRLLQSKLGVDVGSLMFLLEKSHTNGISVGRNRYFIGFPEQFRRLFHTDLGADAGAEQVGQAVLDHCRAAVARFSQAQLTRQRDWLADYTTQTDPNHYGERIKAGYHPILQHGGGLLHLGYAAGFSSTTALLYFLEDQGRRDLFEKVMKKFKLGQRPGAKGDYHPKISRFPKSRRLAEDETKIQPLGWLAVLGQGEEPPELTFPSVTAVRSGGGVVDRTTPTPSNQSTAPPEPAKPEFFTGKFNFKRPPELDAVVVKSGRPNMVKVYFRPDNSPTMKLDAYRNLLDVGTVLRVAAQVSKKEKVLAAAYRKIK